MPQVPVYDRPQVELGQLRQPQAVAPDPRRFGTGVEGTNALARGLQNAGESLDRIDLQEANREAFEVEGEIKKSWLDYSSQLEKNRQGTGAKGVTGEVEKWWAEQAPKLTEKATNGRAQRMLKAATQRMQLAAMEQFNGFETRQLKIAGDAAFESNVRNSLEAIANNPAPENTRLQRESVEAAIRQKAAADGWAPEVLNDRLARAREGASAATFNGILRRDGALAAQDYLDKFGDEIAPAQRQEMANKIKPLVADRKGEDFAASVAALPLDEQVTRAQKIEDPEVRKAAVERIQQNDAMMQAARRRREEAASDTIWQLVGQGAPMGRLPADVLAQMDGRERTALKEHYRAAAERARTEAQGRDVKTDFGTYDTLVNMPPEDFLRVRLTAYQDRLSRGDLKTLIDRQAKLRNPNEAGDVATTEQQMGGYITSLQLKDEKAGMFRKGAYDEFNAFRAANKREPNYDERQKILDRLSMESDGGWFGGSRRFFELPNDPAKRTEFMEQVVPKEDRAEIEKSLKARGVPVTVQNILDVYRAANPQ